MKKYEVIISIVFWIILWEILAITINNSIFFVSPIEVLKEVKNLALRLDFWQSIYFSLSKILLGFFLGVIIGILLAILANKFSIIHHLFSPLILLSKTIPVASFIILALIYISSTNISTLIAFLMTLPIIYTNTLQGLSNLNKELEELSIIFHISKIKYLRGILYPQLQPFIEAGLTLTLSLSIKSGIAAEVIALSNNSIGGRLQEAKLYLDSLSLFALTFVIIIISILLEKLLIYTLKFLSKAIINI